MENEKRQIIIGNLDRLARSIDYNTLKSHCLNSQLVTQVMVENIENDRSNSMPDGELKENRLKSLLTKITKRGPTAFQRFRDILSTMGCDSALNILNNNNDEIFISNRAHYSTSRESERLYPIKPIKSSNSHSSNSSSSDISEHLKLKPYSGELQKPNFTVKKSKSFPKKDEIVDCYPMQSKQNRGVFFMVNNINFVEEKRNGAEKDSAALLYLFKELGFTLFKYEDLTLANFFRLLDELFESEYMKNTECFVMALMSHGELKENTQIIKFINGVTPVQEIEERFSNRYCDVLAGKPKVLLFQFCRGDESDRGITKLQTDSAGKYVHPKVSDLFTCYSALPNSPSHRDIDSGSWYIQILCEVVAEHAHNTHFADLQLKVEDELRKQRSDHGVMQATHNDTKGVSKRLYFNPGIYMEDGKTVVVE